MSTPTDEDPAKVLADPTAYADDDRLHAALTELRANNPVAWAENRRYRPFWAITKHADIMAVERDNELFLSEPARCWPPRPPTTWPSSSSRRALGCGR